MMTLEELRQLAETVPAPEINWDILTARADRLPVVMDNLQKSLTQMEEAYGSVDPYDHDAVSDVLMVALATRIVESRVFLRSLTTAQAVLEVIG